MPSLAHTCDLVCLITSPPDVVTRYCFDPYVCLSVCLCVCLSVCVSGQYFGIYHISQVNVTGTVHCVWKVQSYHKNRAIETFQFFFHRHLLGYSIP